MLITPVEIEAVLSRCPCGAALVMVEHIFGEGEIKNGRVAKINRRFYAALYFDERTGRQFCGPACSLRWHHTFVLGYLEHRRLAR